MAGKRFRRIGAVAEWMRRLAYCLRRNYVYLYRGVEFRADRFLKCMRKFPKKFWTTFKHIRSTLRDTAFYLFSKSAERRFGFLRAFRRMLMFHRIGLSFFDVRRCDWFLRIIVRVCSEEGHAMLSGFNKICSVVSPRGTLRNNPCRVPYQKNHRIGKTKKQFSADAGHLYSAF